MFDFSGVDKKAKERGQEIIDAIRSVTMRQILEAERGNEDPKIVIAGILHALAYEMAANLCAVATSIEGGKVKSETVVTEGAEAIHQTIENLALDILHKLKELGLENGASMN